MTLVNRAFFDEARISRIYSWEYVNFVVFAVLSFFRGTVESDNYFVVVLIELARIILIFFLGIFWGIGIRELTKENQMVLKRRWDFS